MKFLLSLSIIFIGCYFSSFSQEDVKKSKFSPEITVSFNSKSGLVNGLGFGIGLHNAFFNQKRCNLIVGIEYNCLIRKDLNISDNTNNPIYYNNIGIPAYFRVNMGKKVKFFIDVGTFVDFIVMERIKLLPNEKNMNNKLVHNIHKPDFGISGGIGLRIPIKEYELLLKSDYKWGMKHLYDFSLVASYNHYLRFTVGFKFNYTPHKKYEKK